MADNSPIGIFDSGVGGLSVLAEIKKVLPSENFVFLADQSHFPYGAKTKRQLENLSERITNFLVNYYIKLLIIACNTATCHALDYLRSKFNLPIIGVVPAIKVAAIQSKKARVVIMSTPATVKSAYLSSLITDFAPQTHVLKLGCKGLEESVEVLNKKQYCQLLDIFIKKIKNFEADVIVLGCTHFPFLKDEIKKRIGSKVKIIDSGRAIAKRTKFILQKMNFLCQAKSADLYFTTASPDKFSKVASTLLGQKISAQKAII